MKRIAITLAVGLPVFATVYGFAASLGVSADTLGAGNAAVAACQAAVVSVSYNPTYNAGAPAGYRATTVTIGNLDTSVGACGNQAIRVTLTGPGASNASLAEQTGTTPTSGATQAFNFSGISASDVTGVHVVISG
jgi:hypothetical protein